MNDETSTTNTAARDDSFQSRVQPWMLECFGAEIAGDMVERGDQTDMKRRKKATHSLMDMSRASTMRRWQLTPRIEPARSR